MSTTCGADLLRPVIEQQAPYKGTQAWAWLRCTAGRNRTELGSASAAAGRFEDVRRARARAVAADRARRGIGMLGRWGTVLAPAASVAAVSVRRPPAAPPRC